MAEINKAIMMFKGIHKIAPSYLCNEVNLVSGRHQRTRFAAENNVVVPLSKTRFTDRTFINSGSLLWNDLPTEIKTTKSIFQFRNSIKKHFLD